ncbi:hypothetical protein D1007_05972 [Hordeum vulgare]|uniref:F-box domain-containing protein n=1 Tax=Hordeum vulgare subsp. vulgare TaxID=112509 RepID=A0A8I6YQK5_HORVV|nr:hypothetical protein D1007_05972 [Hordeum vulgare]KAI4971902.1 hypothetical protein ZWY2020_002816 [Hordeum vulgare]
MMTRGQRRRLGLADPPSPCAGSGNPRKRPRQGLRPCTAVRLTGSLRRTGLREETEWRDWANLTTGIANDVAVRLLSLNVSEYLRFRAVCKPWRALTEDPRAHGVLDSRFRPHGWFTPSKRGEPPSRRRLLHTTAMARVTVHHQIFSTSRFLCVADGLLVMCDEATCTVRLLHPFTGVVAEFPDITDVGPHEGAEPSARLRMDAFKARFPGLGGGADPDAYLATDDYECGYPAERTVMDFASIDDSTSPPTLQLCVKTGKWLVISAKPGDEHWVSLSRLRGSERVMLHCALLRLVMVKSNFD